MKKDANIKKNYIEILENWKIKYPFLSKNNADNVLMFIYMNADNRLDELCIKKLYFNSIKKILSIFKDAELQPFKRQTMIFNDFLSVNYVDNYALNSYLETKRNLIKSECDKLQITIEYLVKFYQSEIYTIETDIECLKLELETGSEQEVTPETATQPKAKPKGRPKDTDYEKRIIVLDILETALNLKKRGFKLYLQSNYHTTLIRAFHYYHKNISQAKDKLSKLTLEDIQQIKDADIKKTKNTKNKK
jgi:hypothetical protein